MEREADSSSLLDRFRKAITEASVDQWQDLQRIIDSLALFSSNESLDDLTTKSIPLLSIDYHLAIAYFNLPTESPSERRSNILQGVDYLANFLQRMEEYEILVGGEKTKRELHELLQLDDLEEENNENNFLTLSQTSREDKIERFKRKRQLQVESRQLESLKERRCRLCMPNEELMDGHDEESLERTLELNILSINMLEALDEWKQALRELPMLAMQLKMNPAEKQYREGSLKPPGPRPPFKLTHITQDSLTGQLKIRKEEVRSNVFQPGWNQPTMSLEELAEKEILEARQRQEKEQQASQINKDIPKRYNDLVQEGLEDNANLVDASAKLDRDWDDWKAENPKGSGNKMGDRGDRNF
mmetsp:Transcript_17294/g.25551  ORF Transcript_17294/g.25551 Transcript_17294/m.25551 type:complete len:358 (-) Transcript_17294:1554-2627(-)